MKISILNLVKKLGYALCFKIDIAYKLKFYEVTFLRNIYKKKSLSLVYAI